MARIHSARGSVSVSTCARGRYEAHSNCASSPHTTSANAMLVVISSTGGAVSILWTTNDSTRSPIARALQTSARISTRTVASSSAISRRSGASGASTPVATARPPAAMATAAASPWASSIKW